MNILITGGTGLIGRALILDCLKQNPVPNITVLTRNIAKAKSVLPQQLDFIANLDDISLADYQVVVNLAGEPIIDKRWSDKQKKTLCESRWQITQKLVDKMAKEVDTATPIRFISGSAVGMYGRQDSGQINENHQHFFPEFSHHLCQKWEDIALSAENASTAILRTGIVLTAEGGALQKMLLPFKLGLGGKVASGEQYMPWIHLADMIAAIQHLIEHNVITGPVNCTAPNPVTNDDFVHTLASTLRRPCLFPMPEFVLRILFGESADLLIYGQNAVPQTLTDSGFKFQFNNLAEALGDLLKK